MFTVEKYLDVLIKEIELSGNESAVFSNFFWRNTITEKRKYRGYNYQILGPKITLRKNSSTDEIKFSMYVTKVEGKFLRLKKRKKYRDLNPVVDYILSDEKKVEFHEKENEILVELGELESLVVQVYFKCSIYDEESNYVDNINMQLEFGGLRQWNAKKNMLVTQNNSEYKILVKKDEFESETVYRNSLKKEKVRYQKYDGVDRYVHDVENNCDLSIINSRGCHERIERRFNHLTGEVVQRDVVITAADFKFISIKKEKDDDIKYLEYKEDKHVGKYTYVHVRDGVLGLDYEFEKYQN